MTEPDWLKNKNHRKKWKERSGADADMVPEEFVRTYYAAEISSGEIHRGLIRREDPALYWKLYNDGLWDSLNIPTKPQHNTKLLENWKAGAAITPREAIRLYELERKRTRRATRPPSTSAPEDVIPTRFE
ncbi:MAG TPA: hypothetical protein VMV79_06795 [Alphaproteobacteria bacterium]|nr:hypothetical protein [Alphaproteobacteria bacterium]